MNLVSNQTKKFKQMNTLFNNQFYFHFKAPNADQLIAFLDEKNDIDNKVHWADNCVVDTVSLESSPEVIDLISPSLQKLAEELKFNGRFFILHPWINIYNEHSYQEIHEHKECDMSAVFFLNEGDDFAKFYFTDRFSCSLTSSIRHVLNYHDTQTPVVSAGDIIFFPSALYHGVAPHKSKQVRKTMSFNFNFEFE